MVNRRVVTGLRRSMVAAAGLGLGVALTVPASAAPPPSADPLQQFRELSKQAQQVNEDYLKAQADLGAKRQQLRSASATLAQANRAGRAAKVQQDKYRGEVDKLSSASMEGARYSQLSAMLGSESPSDYLQRASALKVMSSRNDQVLGALRSATDSADQAARKAGAARNKARSSTDAATRLTRDIAARKSVLAGQVAQVKKTLDGLSAANKKTVADPGDQGTFVGPAGAVGTAMSAALSQRGKPYVWGAAGPDSYDCSGLTMWAYQKAGISLPHSARAQEALGQPVAEGQWKPGDLLFWGSDRASIHHDAMYIGSGKIVQAATEGEPVKVTPVSGGGSDYLDAKRIVG